MIDNEIHLDVIYVIKSTCFHLCASLAGAVREADNLEGAHFIKEKREGEMMYRLSSIVLKYAYMFAHRIEIPSRCCDFLPRPRRLKAPTEARDI